MIKRVINKIIKNDSTVTGLNKIQTNTKFFIL